MSEWLDEDTDEDANDDTDGGSSLEAFGIYTQKPTWTRPKNAQPPSVRSWTEPPEDRPWRVFTFAPSIEAQQRFAGAVARFGPGAVWLFTLNAYTSKLAEGGGTISDWPEYFEFGEVAFVRACSGMHVETGFSPEVIAFATILDKHVIARQSGVQMLEMLMAHSVRFDDAQLPELLEALAFGEVLRTEEDARALSDRSSLHQRFAGTEELIAASPATAERWRPPHRDGDELVAFVHAIRDELGWVREVRVDTKNYTVEVNEVCDGVSLLYDDVIEGRPYVDNRGTPRLPNLHVHGVEHLAARAWRRAAAAEHASVFAFERVAEELRAVNAPASLVARAQQAARDEARHTTLCLTLADGIDGCRTTLGPLERLAPRAPSLVAVALAAFLEGCVEESCAAHVASFALARRPRDDVKSALDVIAPEEAAHAELAWDTIAWALEQGGAPVARALLSAAERVDKPTRARAHDDARLGCVGGITRARLRRAHLCDVVRPRLDAALRHAKTGLKAIA